MKRVYSDMYLQLLGTGTDLATVTDMKGLRCSMKNFRVTMLVGSLLGLLAVVVVAGWTWHEAQGAAQPMASAAQQMPTPNTVVITAAPFKYAPDGRVLFEPDYRPIAQVTNEQLSMILSQESETCGLVAGSCCTPVTGSAVTLNTVH